MQLAESDFILNADGSIYHLHLKPGELAETVILVGDPERVDLVSQHFDSIEVKKSHREFATHTGLIGKQPVSVVSTGVGIGGVDVVMNELDALVNVNFETREVKPELTSLRILRVGTCGGVQPDAQIHDLIYSAYAFAFDGLMDFYKRELNEDERELYRELVLHFDELGCAENAYVSKASLPLAADNIIPGLTYTCSGFYGPQGRNLRAPLTDFPLIETMQSLRFDDMAVCNFEMESAAIFALGNLLGHQCGSLCTVLANRFAKKFSTDPKAAVDQLITTALEILLDV